MRSALICALAIVALVSCRAHQPESAPVIPDLRVEPTPQAEPLSSNGNESPYRQGDELYHVLPTERGYVETGIASWYGPKFHGRPTSNRERFDMHLFTAAHKTLPLPSYVRVTHLENGNSVIVRVNDRGPFKPGRIIDLSFAAAQKLDIVESGVAQVRVEAISVDGIERPAVRSADLLYIQLGAFSDRTNAERSLAQASQAGFSDVQIVHVGEGEQQFYRVLLGPFDDLEDADLASQQLERSLGERPRLHFQTSE